RGADHRVGRTPGARARRCAPPVLQADAARSPGPRSRKRAPQKPRPCASDETKGGGALMSPWVARYQKFYRLLSRACPYRFRMVCGDGLDRLGEDLVPIVWREQGTLGIMRLFADVIARLPVEYAAAWFGRIEEVFMRDDLFEGTWRSNAEQSKWDPK